MNILQMSFSAAVLIIAIVILRALSVYKLPKKTFLILWYITLCRLLVPFSIPSRFSLYTGIRMLRQTSDGKLFVPPVAITGTPVDLFGITGNAGTSVFSNGATSAVSPSASPLVLVWLIGMAFCTIFFMVSYIRCCKEFSVALPFENKFITLWKQEHPMRLPVRIKCSDRIKAPLTYGVFRPVVLLPVKSDLTDETELRYVLAHEYMHIKRFDTLTKLLLTCALCVHWFNPFVWIMYFLANRDIELSCDEAVVMTFGVSVKSVYALTLIGLEERKSLFTPLCNNFSKNAIEERVTAIMKIKKHSIPVIIVAALLVAGITVGFVTSNVHDISISEDAGNSDTLPVSTPAIKNETTTKPAASASSLTENSIQGDSETDEESVSISKRYYPILGEYLLTRIDMETGDSKVSFDNGATWLFLRIDPKTSEAEYSADGVTWQSAPTD
ncbi:MAG: M56 family metallopeptidase [Bacillota bacterium]|nr:M56 family metallopeptidase [Bacillota bacterium]